MKLGIIGLPQTGKKTLYKLLTGTDPSGAQSKPDRALQGIAEILDGRFDALVKMYRPKKETRARINVELLPDLDPGSIKEGAVFRDIADTSALCHVVRAFADDSVYHALGSVNPERDTENINAELILNDLIFIEKRLERIEQNKKRGKDDTLKKEEDLLLRFKEHLEKDEPLRTFELAEEERKLIASYPFITLKEMICALNVLEGDMTDTGLLDRLSVKYSVQHIHMMQISARLEAEIAALDSEEERGAFMEEAGIKEPAISLLSRLCMEALGMISFFTVGEDEVRQWQIRKSSTAPEAAGAIHSDIQRGFIRAEVMKYRDLMELGSEENVKKAGRHLLMGKEYIVEDGDIISFRFNV